MALLLESPIKTQLMSTESVTKLLVVEDDADDTFLLTRQLSRAQIDDCVTVITNGLDAMNFLLKASPLPLAVFLDLSLPGMSGLDVLRAMKSETRLQDIPVIVMTGSLKPADEAECLQLGAIAYLTKPVGLSTFIKTVTHLFPTKEAAAS
jgi:two-component system response regulator